ncbi:MAG: hypothetical protein PHT53_03760, partial [Candidatus Omnitrophica bacterium]|nr:hypothetical protein [Candidatus Omnitrophota bacterium]
MDNERKIALDNFFKSLRITLNNCSIYFKEHPLFVKSIEKLHTDTLAVLSFLDPLALGITPNSLSVSGEYFEKESLYTDLATFLHRRKIKNIEIRRNITVSDVAIFVTSLSLPVLDIFKEGGLAYLLEKQAVTSVTIEELDYSSLLRTEGQEQKDVWAYLLKRAVKEKNEEQIKNIVENFDATLEKIAITDFSENENLRTSVAKFLNFLKTQEEQNFNKCARVLIRAVSNSKAYTGKDKMKQLAFLADSLTPQEITDILCQEVSSQDAFNVKSIELFSSLLDRSQNESVASALAQRIKKESGYNTTTVKKTKELLASLEESSVKMIYQYALGSLIMDMGLAGSLSFDSEQMKKNYRTMLLNLFAEERITLGLLQIAERIYAELDKVFNDKDTIFVHDFFTLIAKKIDSGSGIRNILEEIKVKTDRKLEEALLLQKIDVDSVIGLLSKTTFDKNFYLNKIFIEKDINYNLFSLYFNFFPRDISEFYREIKINSSDINFIKKIIEVLKNKDSKITCDILESIFYTASRFLKMEILQILQNFSNYNVNFILSILLEVELPVKRQAMSVVMKNNLLRQKAAGVLLSIPNRFGLKNKIINENINMIGEFRLIEARAGLENISKLKA